MNFVLSAYEGPFMACKLRFAIYSLIALKLLEPEQYTHISKLYRLLDANCDGMLCKDDIQKSIF